MSDPSKISQQTLKQRLVRNLSHGLYQLEIGGKTKKENVIGITYYLLNDGKIINHREWYQSNKPDYIVCGTKEGCESHWKRTKNI